MRRLFYILVWSIIGWVGGGCVHVNLTRLADNHKDATMGCHRETGQRTHCGAIGHGRCRQLG